MPVDFGIALLDPTYSFVLGIPYFSLRSFPFYPFYLVLFFLQFHPNLRHFSFCSRFICYWCHNALMLLLNLLSFFLQIFPVLISDFSLYANWLSRFAFILSFSDLSLSVSTLISYGSVLRSSSYLLNILRFIFSCLLNCFLFCRCRFCFTHPIYIRLFQSITWSDFRFLAISSIELFLLFCKCKTFNSCHCLYSPDLLWGMAWVHFYPKKIKISLFVKKIMFGACRAVQFIVEERESSNKCSKNVSLKTFWSNVT